MSIDIRCCDALDLLRSLPDKSVNLIATDPPYFRVKDEPWDRAWSDADGFLSWLGDVADEWRRVLADNGTLYVFASPQMAARVQMVIAERFQVLNEVVWNCPTGKTSMRVSRETLRKFLPTTERIVVAEQFGADGSALRGSGYDAACAQLHAGVFEPLRQYLADELERSGLTVREVAEAYQRKTGSRTVTGMAGHWFQASQWALPTDDNYRWLRSLLNADGGDYLRREYDYLRREYEDLRRPFTVTSDVPYTDVWTYPTVPPARRGGKRHPCAKPVEMMEHIIQTSSRDGDTVLDCFLGGGATAVAAHNLRRPFIGCDMSQDWVDRTLDRLDQPEQLSIGDAA